MSVLRDAQACLMGQKINYTMPWIDLSVRRMLGETQPDPPTWSRACCARGAEMRDREARPPGCCGLPTVRALIFKIINSLCTTIYHDDYHEYLRVPAYEHCI